MANTTNRPGEDDVARFVDAIEDPVKREDSLALIRIMSEVTGEEPKLWGAGVIGFGSYHYRYASGREGEGAKVGFSPRKTNLTIYLLSGLVGYDDLLSKLGKHTSAKSCIYVKRLDDLDKQVLTDLIARAVEHVEQVEQELGGLPRDVGDATVPGRLTTRYDCVAQPPGQFFTGQSISTCPLISPRGKLVVWTLT